jgi:hypothetical protein
MYTYSVYSTMYTSINDNIIIHKLCIHENTYIRIVSVKSTHDYFAEISKAYGYNTNVQSKDIAVFYNCGDLYQRLIHDLEYKKFKGVVMTKICPGLWRINNSHEEWYQTSYLSWVTSKLQSYIDDMDEVCDYLQLVPENIDWNAVNKNKLVNTAFKDITSYTLQRLEKNAKEDYVITRDHILSLVFEYIGIHHACILGYDNIHSRPEVEKNTDELKIRTLQTMRGVTINKDVLSNDEVHELFQYLNISNDTLKSIVVSKSYLQVMQDTAQHSNVESETSVFQTFYSFIQDTNPIGDNSINSVFESNKNGIQLPWQLPLPSPCDFWKSSGFESKARNATKADETDTLSHTVVYNNVIDDSLNMFDIELVYLREFHKVSSLAYRDVVTKSVLDTINKTQISDKLVQELKQLLSILEHWEKETCAVPDDIETWSIQKRMTKAYVDNYKDDAMETLASTVIDNVYNYLENSTIPKYNINKNQIGTDLVDLGVKKTRKTKGYVYGIEDTSQSNVLQST